MSIADKGYILGHNNVVTAKVSSASSDIVKGDILVLAAVGGASHSGYVKQWAAATDEIVGVALEAADTPSSDGDVSVEMMLTRHGPLFRFDASGIAQGNCFQCCDVDGAQSIDVTADTYQNAWIVEVDTANSMAIVMLLSPALDLGATDVDFGTS